MNLRPLALLGVLLLLAKLSLPAADAPKPASPDSAPPAVSSATNSTPAPPAPPPTATNSVAAPAAAPVATNSPAAAPPPVIAQPPSAAKPTASTAPVSKTERNIRFQFEGIPYTDVIERFAQMAGKPLLADTNIQGTVTYDDPHPYNYAEALDTLNLILAMKGVMLAEDGNNLRLVPFKQLPSLPIRIVRGMENTGEIRPNEVVTVVLDINNLDAKELVESVVPMLSTAGSIAPLAKGRGVIITDRMANIQRVRNLLAAIGTDQATDRQMKTFNILHASGAIVSDLLNRTFGVATAPKRTTFNPNTKVTEVLPPDPNDYITSVYDEASRTLVLFGPPERITLAEQLINKFEQKGGAGGDVRIYYPASMKVAELATMIRQAVPGVAEPNEPSASSSMKARIIADASQNRLIVAAPVASQLDQIEQLILRLDQGAKGTFGSGDAPFHSQTIQLTRIFRPRVTQATNLAEIVKHALTRRNLEGQVITTASVSPDASSGSVVVTGSPSDLQIASDIVTQLETGVSQPTARRSKFIDVGSPQEARRLQPLVQELYLNQASDGGAEAAADVKIIADTESGRLIVTGSEEHLARIENIVRQIREDKPKVVTRQLKVFTLKNTRAETALPGIQNLVAERMTDRRFVNLTKPSLIADAPNNRLLVTATEDQLKEIEEVVAVVDIAPAEASRQIVILPLHVKPAAEIIPLVSQLLTQLAAPGQLPPSLTPDTSGKQIIVLAAPKDQERVRELVQQFDTSAASAAPRAFREIPLLSRRSTDLAPLVQQLYQEQIRGQPEPPGGAATVIADAKNNQLMVSGSDKEISRVEAIIRQLDPAEAKANRQETRVVRLKVGTAGDLASLVEKSLNAQSQQIQILVDARSNSLVVTGAHDTVEAAVAMIQQLDTRDDASPREIRVIELKSGEAATLAPMVTTLFAEMLRDQRGADYVSQTRIVPDIASNRLVVTGNRVEIELVAGLVAKLDDAPSQSLGSRVFKLNTTEAATMATIVSNALVRFDERGRPLHRASVSADETSNSLIVSGARADLRDAESVIQKLDGPLSGGGGGVSGGNERVLRIFEIKGDPDALASLVQKVFAAQNPGRNVANLLSVTPEPGGKRLFVLALSSMIPQIETLITSLDEKPDQGRRELHPIELSNSTAADILPRVKQIYGEQSQGKTTKPATIYTDASGARLLVQGTPEQASAIKQIVATLESDTRAPRASKVIDLGKLSEAQRILPVARELYKDQLTSSPQLGPADAQIVSDGKTGRLFVSASTAQLDSIEKIINSLRVGTNDSQALRETHAFEVGGAADVERVLPLLQQLYRDQLKDKLDTDPADAQFVADPKTGRIIVTGKTAHLKQIEALLQQLGAGKAHGANRDTRMMDLTTTTAAEIVATVRALYLEEAKGRLGNQTPDTLIMPDAGANRLIVVGETNELAAVEGIVHKLDKVSAQSATTRVFKIKSADPDKVSEILANSLIRFDAYGRPQKRATVAVDAKTRTIIVTGDPKELQGVALIIEQLDQSLGSQPDRKMKVLTLKQGKVALLSPRVREIYKDRVLSQPELSTSDLLIMDEAESNQLILSGTEAQINLAGQIVEELQSAQVARAARETKMLAAGTAEEMGRLLPLVQQLYKDRMRGRDASDPADAQIIADEKNGRFIVTARANHLAEIEKILAQLRGENATPEVRDTRVYDLATASAADLAATVRTLYQEQAKTRPGAPAADTLILPDSSANRIIVTGATNEIDIVEQIIKKLDKVGAQSASTRVFKLKSADPDKVVEILATALVKYDAYGRPQKRVSVVTDAKTRTLIATGDPKELQSASVIIEQLDASLGEQPGRVMRVIPVKDRRASELVGKVRQIYDDQARNQSELGTVEPLILGDPTSNQLILAGTEKQLTVIQGITELLQSGPEAGLRQTKVFTLEKSSATLLVNMLTQVYTRQIASVEPTERIVVTPGGNDRTLVVEAPANALARIEELVKSLDQPGPEGHNIIQTIHLTKGRAEDVADAVNRAITNRTSTTTARRASVIPVAGANTIIINGTTNAVQEVIRIIRDLDQEGDGAGQPEIRIYKLENGGAKQVSALLQQLLQSVTRNLRAEYGEASARRIPDPSVSVDDRSNSLIVSGTASHFKVVEKILPTLDKAPERSDRDVQFVWLRKAKAFDVETQLEALFEDRPRSDRPVIDADFQGNSLTIIAKKGDLAQIQDLVARLDEQGKASALQVRLRPLDHVAAEQMAQMLKNIYPQMSGVPLRVTEKVNPQSDSKTNSHAITNAPEVSVAIDKSANALILSGPASELDNIDRLISELSQNFYGNESEFRLFSIVNADPVNVASALTSLLKQDVIQMPQAPGQPPVAMPARQHITVVAEPRARSIIVRARPTDFNLLESLIKQLDNAGQTAQIDFRVIPLTNAPPAQILPIVQSLVTQLNLARPGEGVTVTLDSRSRGLVVIARDAMAGQVEKMIRSLDKPSDNAEAQVRVIQLKKAGATQLAAVLENMLKPGALGETTPEARELQNQVTRLKILNDHGEPVTLDLTRPIKISTDPATGAGGANRVILTSTPDNLRALAAVVEMLDAIPIIEGGSIRFYTLDHADPAAMQKLLTDLFTGPRASTMRPEERPSITVDARSSTLVVAGNAEAFAIVEALVKQLDQKLPFNLRDLALIPLDHTDATALAPTLQKLMDARVTQRATLNQGQADQLKVIIMADQRSNSLLVGGSREGFDVVQILAKQLDQASPALSGNVRLVPLKYADARMIAATLGTLFEQRYAASRTPEDQRRKPILIADPRGNALLVAASQDDNAALDDLLKRLDVRQENPSLRISVIPLKHNDSARIATSIESIFAARLRAQTIPGQTPLPGEQIKIEPDDLNNALIISAGKENLDLIQNLVDKLDRDPVVADGVFETFTLQFADAQRVSNLLKSLVDQGLYRPGHSGTGKSGSGRDVLSLTVDERSNTLIVSASPSNLEIVRTVIKRIDTKDMAQTDDVRLYSLKNARASTVATTLQQFFQARRAAESAGVNSSERAIPASVIADDRVNTVLVTGGRDAFELVDRVLPQLDGDSTFSRLNFRVFPLKKATATKLQATLQPIFANRPAKVKAETPDPVTIIADRWVNALLVGATVEDLATISSLIERLDSEPSDTGIAIHVFPLKKADATRVSTTIQSLFRESQTTQLMPISVAADERMNALIVSCGENDAARVAELVKKLDTDQVSKVSEIKIFPLQYARADTLSTILNTSLNTKPAALNDQNPNAQSLLQFAARDTNGNSIVTAALKESVLITPDLRMNALIVSGPVEYMTLLEQVIHRLDASSPQQAKIKVFPLRNADARQMGQLLVQLFRMTPTGGATGGAATAQRSVQYTFVRPADPGFDDSFEEDLATATLGTAEQSALTVTIDPRTNSLLVGGSDRYIDLVSRIIEQLDSSSARERRSEVIRMKNSQAQDVATAIRTFLDQQRQRAVQALGADAATASARTFDQEEVAITAEPVSNTLLLSAHHQYFEQMRKMIDDLDAPQPQVLIQILLAEVTLTSQTDLGAEWSLTRHGGDGETYSVGSSLGVANSLQSLGGFSTAASGTDLNFLIRALTTDGKLAVLSRPEIVTGDNKPASINVGQRVPLVQGTRTDVNNNLSTTINYEQVGISLTVTPKISPEGFVKMDIGMTNSDVSAQTVTIAGAGTVPILDEAFANTTVTAHSGQTIIIGGLIATSDSKTIQKLPYFGDIPYIGAAFRTTSVIRNRKELLILLTPHVLANHPVPSPLEDPSEVTRNQIKASNLRDGFAPVQRKSNLLDMAPDKMEHTLLNLYFPTNSASPSLSLPPSTNSITIPK